MKNRGLTLVEVIVVTALLAVTVGLTVMSYIQSLKVQRKAEMRSDAYRTMVVTLAHLEKGLRGVRIESAQPGKLQYRVPQTSNGKLVVDAAGDPIFGETVVVELLADGVLQQSTVGVPDKDRVVSRLGKDATVEFVLNADATLSISMSLYEPDDLGKKHSALTTVFLGNQ